MASFFNSEKPGLFARTFRSILYIKDITESEWKVIGLVSKGLSNKEIATELFLTEGSVRNYLSSVLKKLDLRDRTQLAIWAVQWRKS